MINITKELHATAKANAEREIKKSQAVLDSINAQLAEEDSADASLLKYFGTSEIISKEKKRNITAKSNLIGEALTIKDIEKVCKKYALRFLSTEQYVKEIPMKALNDLRKFKEENGISDRELSRQLMIIAPVNHFKLGPRPQKDPVLIYKSYDEQYNESYKVVSQWGSDFSYSRRLLGLLNYSVINNLPFVCFILSIISIFTFFVLGLILSKSVYCIYGVISFIPLLAGGASMDWVNEREENWKEQYSTKSERNDW